MDVSELLNFKPTSAPKRPAASTDDQGADFEDDFDDDPNESYEKRAAKRQKLKKAAQKKFEEQRMAILEAEAAAAAASAQDAEGTSQHDDLLAKIDTDDANDDVLDDNKLKRMILNFEKKVAKNQELRIKFPDEPSKFMNSELELHEAVQVGPPMSFRILTYVPKSLSLVVENCNDDFCRKFGHFYVNIVKLNYDH